MQPVRCFEELAAVSELIDYLTDIITKLVSSCMLAQTHLEVAKTLFLLLRAYFIEPLVDFSPTPLPLPFPLSLRLSFSVSQLELLPE